MERAVMQNSIKILGTNADYKACQTKELFRLDQYQFVNMLASYISPNRLYKRLLAAKRNNLSLHGYGMKSFVLSMMDTAVNV